ncbi:hypothetical protein SLEP1_g41011 [Rubroshorea leprosula]|uniref:Uncharacterized protein n=1 Tax=Rubroshorea leprosula TaxID=152421 RepID=A0AAV5L577_9ROSI|nr:hypothetical protein SLEP1_g41011 [Rubroshorea leprosula]
MILEQILKFDLQILMNVRSRGDTIRQHLVGLYPSTGRWPPDVVNRSSIRFLKM